MAELDGCEHHIFVSYAHVDDDPLIEGQPGWVTELVRKVRKLLARKLGRQEACDLWMDWNLKGNDAVTPEILDALGKSAILLMIFSPGYKASVWCQREFSEYVQHLKATGHSGRLFVVENERVDHGEWPEAIRDLKGFRFWREDPDAPKECRRLGYPAVDPNEREYWDTLENLASTLAEKIMEIRNSEDPGRLKDAASHALEAHPAEQQAVFVAAVTGDLVPLRNQIIAYLKQASVPTCSTPLYGHASAECFQQALSTDLGRCKLFVQLLSGVSSEKPPGSSKSYARLQLESAVAGGSEILQWRQPSLDVASVTEEGHRKLLDGESVLAIGIEQFKASILERFREPEPQPIPAGIEGALEIFIVCDQSDRPVATTIAGILKRKRIGFSLSGESDYGLREFGQKVHESDAVIIVYGASEKSWVEHILIQIKKIIRDRAARKPVLAVCEGPPPRELPDIWLPNIEPLEFQQSDGSFTLPKFDAFLQLVRDRQKS